MIKPNPKADDIKAAHMALLTPAEFRPGIPTFPIPYEDLRYVATAISLGLKVAIDQAPEDRKAIALLGTYLSGLMFAYKNAGNPELPDNLESSFVELLARAKVTVQKGNPDAL